MEELERRIRREMADWDFIRSQPPRVRAALELYVETGDLRLAQKLSGLGLEEFYLLTKKARIPVVVLRKRALPSGTSRRR